MYFFLMYLRILLLIIGLRSLGVQGKQNECGEHGRFEYCVDGVPSCVVGCHCHPGYYFDTETKICEPNKKLVQDYRRRFLPEPTRVQIPITPDYEIDVTPTLTTKSPLDDQVDQALAQDTDDIGDWLYNQFFKTIENQVLSAHNNTKNTNIDANNQTRRFGPTQKKGKRRKVKKIKFSKISKKDDLRRKLLRITEDDSIFDSDSRSTSSEDYGSSSDSDSSGTSLETDDESYDKNYKDKNHNKHPNDKEHGHRKILVVNKKPKPPLPSFIFLPNLETPFYAPIGLPPPPPMPMFPMVPVPPMPMPPFPITIVIPSTASTTKATEIGSTSDKPHDITKTTRKPTEEDYNKHSPENKDPSDEQSQRPVPVGDSDKSNAKSRSRNVGHNPPRRPVSGGGGDKAKSKPRNHPSIPRSSLGDLMLKRKKLLQQFQNKPHGTRKSIKQAPPINPLMPSVNDYMDEADMMEFMAPTEGPPAPPPVDFKYISQLIHKIKPHVSNEPVKNKMSESQSRFESPYYHQEFMAPTEGPPAPPPVDFKYISQLIHKLKPHVSNEPVKNRMPEPQRRFESPYYHQESPAPSEPFPPVANELATMPAHLPEGEDSYYANLGQQIASLIRKIDNTAPQPNPKIQSTHESKINGDNSFASRSFWERSVRSLFSHYPPNSNDINFLRNEENLLNLENKVNVVATTQRTWDLNELENVIFIVDRIKSRIHNMKTLQDTHNAHLAKQTTVKIIEPLESLKVSEAENLNVNLLPRQSDNLLSDRKESTPLPERRNIPETDITTTMNETINKTVSPLEEFINKKNIHYNLRGILMQNFKNIFQKSEKQTLKHATLNGTNINYKSIQKPLFEGTSLRKLIRMDQLQSEPQNKPSKPRIKPRVKPRRKHDGSSERLSPNVKVLTKVSSDVEQLSPMLSNYKHAPLYPSHHNKYIFENDALAFQLAPAQQERAYYQVPHHHNYFD